MRDFFRSKLFLFTLIVLLLSGGLLLASAVRRGDALFLSRAVNVVVAPFQKAGSAVSGLFGGVSESIYETDRLKKENEELQQSQKIAMSLEEEEEQHALEEGTVAQEVPAPAHEEAEEEAADSEAGEEAEQEEESSEQE